MLGQPNIGARLKDLLDETRLAMLGIQLLLAIQCRICHHLRMAAAAPHRSECRERNLHAPSLDWLNFLLADVRGGLAPYVIEPPADPANASAIAPNAFRNGAA